MKLYLDDTRPTPDGWTRAYTAQETIEYLMTGQVVELSLDHDLGIEEIVGNGYMVLQWIEQEVFLRRFKAPSVMAVHSANGPATERMLLAIESIRRMAEGETAAEGRTSE
ncbi:MAG: hypothetical protein NTZ35_00620 [Ignavibacteriales bacterium]|nr:hypothetical protein [Ignavibacteriales bacterium]